jgi:hypothetical protein
VRLRALVATLVGFAVVLACTGSYLYDEQRGQQLPVDRTVTLKGTFCGLGANDVIEPIKILVAMDASQSMKVTDPNGDRATALVQLLQSLPQEPEVYISVLLFAGSTSVWLTNNNTQGFVPLISLTPADQLLLQQEILNYTNPDSNRDSTDFVKPLSDIYAAINQDIATAALDPDYEEAKARYSVIFLSDGHPTFQQDEELIEGDAVTRIRDLRDLAEDVRFNTVHVFNPTQPVSSVCDLSGDAGTGCPLLIINQDAERLEKMAELGGGDFRDFRNHEPINYLSFRFGQLRRAYVLEDFVASNRQALAGSPIDAPDTDGDRLSDDEELDLGTDPLKADTDGDGFSDGVEVHFADLGAPFDPAQVATPDGGGLDPGCPVALRGVDSDCDGLLDCDEQIIGTNAAIIDSDRDGISDQVEWQLTTVPSADDLAQDPDGDGVGNRDELRRHSDPHLFDTSALTQEGYRYTIHEAGPPDGEGRQCYAFQVDNVLLEPTLSDTRDGGTGRGAGYNDLTLTLTLVPADDPHGRPIVRAYRFVDVRYPIGGIKSPPDGVIEVKPEEFVPACQGTSPLGL